MDFTELPGSYQCISIHSYLYHSYQCLYLLSKIAHIRICLSPSRRCQRCIPASSVWTLTGSNRQVQWSCLATSMFLTNGLRWWRLSNHIWSCWSTFVSSISLWVQSEALFSWASFCHCIVTGRVFRLHRCRCLNHLYLLQWIALGSLFCLRLLISRLWKNAKIRNSIHYFPAG